VTRSLGLLAILPRAIETARALTDLLDVARSLRLEVMIVVLIVFEVLITLYELLIKPMKLFG
jgi:uncharacterized Rmd1/YagE family protein